MPLSHLSMLTYNVHIYHLLGKGLSLIYKNLYFLIRCMISDSDSSHHFSNLQLFTKDDIEYVFQDMNFSFLMSLQCESMY